MAETRQKKYILTVDDDPKNLKLIHDMLVSKGYRVVAVDSGAKALAQVKAEKPTLVLLDIMMPEMDGIEALREIKALDEDIPVAMVTAVWDESEAKKCMDLGAYEYVTKPIDFKRLEMVVLFKLFMQESSRNKKMLAGHYEGAPCFGVNTAQERPESAASPVDTRGSFTFGGFPVSGR